MIQKSCVPLDHYPDNNKYWTCGQGKADGDLGLKDQDHLKCVILMITIIPTFGCN